MGDVSSEQRKTIFDYLCRNGSPELIKYTRAYEGITRPPHETMEVSCELVDGMRADRCRVAIFNLTRQDVFRWLNACKINLPSGEIVFENAIDECFMIGLADYASNDRGCRIKIYNEYGTSKAVKRGEAHAKKLFSLLDVPDHEFQRDLEFFAKIKISAVEFDSFQIPLIKIYYGNFDTELLFGRFSKLLTTDEMAVYHRMREIALLPDVFHFCVRYSKSGRSLKIELNCRSRKIVPYLKLFDERREASSFFAELYRMCPDLRLEFVSLQWTPLRKVQFYFKLY